ncbi:CREB3 regulatory factor isoform X2 [Sceloporus undulatus]|uniref:CREB3 regulatory factor isoform X2 n=1 Tax=Sceloporus undulatus TaxID=8520 RepID=UPI001C4CE273|nr:CREB3 regulatory factor isoform X2 [Sceloporus undulatus]
MNYMLPVYPEEKLERNLQANKTQHLDLDLVDLGVEMPQPSVSGMDPPFGDAFRSHMFSEQTLMSTDLLANSSDPDFMYELDRGMDYQPSSRDNLFSVEDCKDLENLESFTDLLDTEPCFPANWEQWDTYSEDLTKYTKLTSCDIWGTKEVDYLGLDDFSSPYQDEEVISKTPTLAQLNSEDSQPVSDPLCYPELLFSVKQTQMTSLPMKKIATRATAPVCSSKTAQAETPLAEFPQKASKPNSSTQIMVKTNVYSNEKVNIHVECKDYVKKAKVKINPVHQSRSAMSQANSDAAKENTCFCGAVAKKQERKGNDSFQSPTVPVLPFKETQALLLTPPQETPGQVAEDCSLSASTSVSDPSQKKEEHNYSLFITDGLDEHAGKADAEEEEEEVEDEDHDEGFGSEHELSENDEEEDDYEDDKDDDISDTFSEPGYENDSVEDLKEMTAISCRKRGKRRYFWEYSEQLTPAQERMLRPSEWNRDTLPSNMYQKNGLHHGKYAVKKSRRTDVEDLTPNPKKLLQIGNELRKLNKVISDLTPVSELPLTARPRSRKEKNKLASRACRLKKKAQYEANKVKLWGLNTEYGPPVSGQTSEFVNQVLEKTAEGDPTGGLVGLRIPTSKV